MQHVQTYSYFGSDDRYISQYTVYLVMSFRHIYDLLLCAIWVRHAYNVRFNSGPCLENVSIFNKSTLDNSPPPNYDKESKVECHHVNNDARYKWYVKLAAFQVIAPTRSNYGRKINVKNRNKSTILIFLPAIIELVQELLISNMHNKLEEDTCENVEVIMPTRSNY